MTVIVLDVNPIITENCKYVLEHSKNWLICWLDNIVYYKCDVSKWEEVEMVSQKIITEVSSLSLAMDTAQCFYGTDW